MSQRGRHGQLLPMILELDPSVPSLVEMMKHCGSGGAAPALFSVGPPQLLSKELRISSRSATSNPAILVRSKLHTTNIKSVYFLFVQASTISSVDVKLRLHGAIPPVDVKLRLHGRCSSQLNFKTEMQ